MSTPERQQDPGETGYGGTAQDPNVDEPIELPVYPLDEPDGDEDQEAPAEQEAEERDSGGGAV